MAAAGRQLLRPAGREYPPLPSLYGEERRQASRRAGRGETNPAGRWCTGALHREYPAADTIHGAGAPAPHAQGGCIINKIINITASVNNTSSDHISHIITRLLQRQPPLLQFCRSGSAETCADD